MYFFLFQAFDNDMIRDSPKLFRNCSLPTVPKYVVIWGLMPF